MRDRLLAERVARLHQAVVEVHKLGNPDLDAEAAYLVSTLALELVYVGKYQEGIELLEGLVNPTWTDHYLLGLAWAAQGLHAEALEWFDRAVNAVEASPSCWFYYGVTLGQLDRVDEEEQAYRRCLELDPTYYEAWFNLGLLLEVEAPDKALRAWEQCLDLEPEFWPAHNAIGSVLGNQGQYQEAAAAFTNAIQQNPTYWAAWYGLAHTLEQLGLGDEAQRALAQIPPAVLAELAAEGVDRSLATPDKPQPPKLGELLEEDYSDSWGYKYDEYTYDDAPEVDVDAACT